MNKVDNQQTRFAVRHLLRGRVLGAVFFIAGTAIGAGMLATPVVSAPYGFFPTICWFLVCWVLMTVSAYAMLEVNLSLPAGTNLISMARATLGTLGATLAWVTYLGLLYLLMSAYIAGLSDWLALFLTSMEWPALPVGVCQVLVAVSMGLGIYWGTGLVDKLNRICMCGLGVIFFTLFVEFSPHLQFARLVPLDWTGTWRMLPVLATTFGYQIVVPTLRQYLQETGPDGPRDNIPLLCRVIFIGGAIPLLIYCLWQVFIMGLIPLGGEHGLLAMHAKGHAVKEVNLALARISGGSTVHLATSCLVFFIIVTSYIGVSQSVFDFLSDGLKTYHTALKGRMGRCVTLMCAFIPPLLWVRIYPEGFIKALGYGGVFVALLLILLPALMAWGGRRRFRTQGQALWRMPGGHLMLVVLVLFACAVAGVQCFLL